MPMRFPYLKAARVKLQERRNQCMKASADTVGTYISYFLDFISRDAIIAPIVRELQVVADEKFSDTEKLVDPHGRSLLLPDTEVECAAYHLRLLQLIIHPTDQFPHYSMIFGKGSNRFQDMAEDFCDQVLRPLSAYLDERIDDGDLLLYMLCRYQRECAWFEGSDLDRVVQTTDSRKLEAALDEHLRAWLFREGIDYPFSAPVSPSGRADIVIWQNEEPLPIEVKVFDDANRDIGHLQQGLWQAYKYAADYGKPFGYLVIFNAAPVVLSFEGAANSDGPPCIPVGDRNVFVVVVNALPPEATASKEKPLPRRLVGPPS